MSQKHNCYDRAYLLAQQGRYELAKREVQTLLAQDPNHAEGYLLLSYCHSKQNLYKEAIAAATQAVTLAPDDDACYFEMSRAYYNVRKWRDAQVAISIALTINPNNAEAHGLAGQIFNRQRKYQDALECSYRGLSLDPHNTTCHYVQMMVLMRLRRFGEAKMMIASILAQAPDSPLPYAAQGWVAVYEEKAESAQEAFREALRLDPDDGWAQRGMIEALKSRSMIYRWVLKTDLWLEKLLDNWRFDRMLPRLLLPLMVIYLPIRIWIIGLRAGFNFTLGFDPYGRMMMTPRGIWVSSVILGWVTAVFVGTILTLVFADPWIIFRQLTLICLLILSLALTVLLGTDAWREKTWLGRIVAGGMSALSLLICIIVLAVMLR